MTKSTAACSYADRSSPPHLDSGNTQTDRRGEPHFSLSESKHLQISPSFIREHLSAGHACNSQLL